jgi:hypothetical protein
MDHDRTGITENPTPAESFWRRKCYFPEPVTRWYWTASTVFWLLAYDLFVTHWTDIPPANVDPHPPPANPYFLFVPVVLVFLSLQNAAREWTFWFKSRQS